MSNEYTNAAKRLKVGHPIAKAILLFLADGATDSGFWHFGDISTIANVLELGESTVRKYLDYLANPNNPFIDKQKIGKKNGYYLLFEPQKPKKKNDENDGSPLHQSGVKKQSSPLRQSGQKTEHRYNVESSPLPHSTATTERHNLYLKGFKSLSKPHLNLTREHREIWETILGKIEAKLDPQFFDSWFRFIKLEKVENQKIYISATTVNREWVEKFYADLLKSASGEFEIVWNTIDELEEAA